MNAANLMTTRKKQDEYDDDTPQRTRTTFGSSSEDSADGSQNDDSTSNKDDDQAQKQKRPQKFKAFLRDFSLWKLIDPSQPWVLVEEGSFMGFFDWIPRHIRVGPWSVAALSYIFVMYYLLFLAGAYFYDSSSSSSSYQQEEEETLASMQEQQEMLGTHHHQQQQQQQQQSYPGPWTPQWLYQVAGFGWMNYIIYLVLIQSPLAKAAWATFTIQSWTWMMVRHFLCVIAPWSPTARLWADWMRFPVAFSATTTFVLWNLLIFPIIYVFGMKTTKKRRAFLKFCFSFRMVNIHFVNMLLCCLNCGTWANPPSRPLDWFDFYLGFAYSMVYITWYLCVLDRLGVHFYPIFSPRLAGWKLVVAWSTLVGTLLACFVAWRHFLVVGPPQNIVAGVDNMASAQDAWVERATLSVYPWLFSHYRDR